MDSRIIACVAVLALIGCGDDDASEDASTDASSDSDTDDARDTGRDTSGDDDDDDDDTDAGDELVLCDPLATDVCASDEKCSVVIVGSGTSTQVAFVCVPKPLPTVGDYGPCNRRYDPTPADTTDVIRSDDCLQGYFCWPAPDRIDRCQQLCGLPGPDCGDEQFCLGLNSAPPFGLCQDTRPCDPVGQTGCRSGEGCYVVNNSAGDLLSTCSAVVAEPLEVGEECTSFVECEAGSQCLRAPGDSSGTRVCRAFCDASPPVDGGTDAGTDASDDASSDASDDAAEDASDDASEDAAEDAAEDAGTDAGEDAGPARSGTCEDPELPRCVALPVDEGADVRIEPAPGVCLEGA